MSIIDNKKTTNNTGILIRDQNAEYVFISSDKSVWLIDFIIGIAFKTPIDFYDELNGLYQSGRTYRLFEDIVELQLYLDTIVKDQEIVVETTINPKDGKERDDPKILWQPKLIPE
jgi:hypothetical protein